MKEVIRITFSFLLFTMLSTYLVSCKNNRDTKNNIEAQAFLNQEQSSVERANTGSIAFLHRAQASVDLQLATAKLALNKSKNVDILSLANSILIEYRKTKDELKTLVETNAVLSQTMTNVASNDEFIKLQKSNGSEFDNQFVSLLINENLKNIEEYRLASKSTVPYEVQVWASKNVTMLTSNLQNVKAIEQQLNHKIQ